jgi:hypothetical protein
MQEFNKSNFGSVQIVLCEFLQGVGYALEKKGLNLDFILGRQLAKLVWNGEYVMIVGCIRYHVVGTLHLPFLSGKPAAYAAIAVLAGCVPELGMSAVRIGALVHVHAKVLGTAIL